MKTKILQQVRGKARLRRTEIEKPVKSKTESQSVGGFVRWEDGSPAAGVTVKLFTSDGEALNSATPDWAGRFDLANGTCGLVYFEVCEKNRVLHTTAALPIALRGKSHEVVIELPGTAPKPGAKRAVRPTLQIGAFPVDAAVFDKATPDTVRALARAMVEREPRGRDRTLIEALSPGLLPSRHMAQTLCGTSILLLIEEIVLRKGWPRELLLEIDDILAMRDSGFAEEIYDCPNFRITYQTAGSATVDPDSSAANVTDPGTATVIGNLPAGAPPTYIKRVCFWLERALAAYVAPPFSMRNPAAGGRIPVVINSAGFGSASPSGTFYLNNALNPDLLCAVTVHELFHMVQFMYPGSGTWRGAMLEGGAVFAEDSSADSMNRYLDECGTNFNGIGVMADPNQSLSSAAYKTCLFWRYIAEQQSPDTTEPFVGVETYRRIIELCSAGSFSTADIKQAIRELPWYQDFYEFGYLDPARLDRLSSETTWGNYALACYLKDLGTNTPDARFDFIEDEENIFIDQVIPGAPPSTTLASVTLAGTATVTTTTGAAFNMSVNAFAHRYFEVTINPAVTSVQVDFTAGAGLTSRLFQIALIDTAGAVRDIHRTDAGAYSKRITNLRGGVRLQKLAVIVSGAETGGSFSVNVASAAAAPDVMVTRWHSASQNEYEIDSRNWAWTWVSPDVWVDNDNDGNADGNVFFNFNNQLHIRLHNKGSADAAGLSVQLFYQNAASGLSDAAWLPVQNTGGTVQTITGATLAAGASNDFVVNWSPAPSGGSNHFCIRAIVSAPGDPNGDNKRVLSNFGNVVVAPGGFVDLRLLAAAEIDVRKALRPRIKVIPRCDPQFEILPRDLRERDRLPGESAFDLIRVRHRKLKNVFTHDEHEKGKPAGKAAKGAAVLREHGLARLETTPDPTRFYKTDPRALPPGVEGKPLITIVHEVDGRPLGGMTFMLTVGKPVAASKAAHRNAGRK